ncbi:9559_t:CDS:10 [Paraglomus brasilianum]|uniref:9559_t:CDS:1 n=1 Tax=Paraglomus brasilianum TaxID=144538 RepID=A0A9N9FLW2_9GLOM|nr:9559_t:CDS:10 [Paraglomus brasilianum]
MAEVPYFGAKEVDGHHLSEFPIVFSANSKYFYNSARSSIRIYSVETGDVVRHLSISPSEAGHTGKITCLEKNPKNQEELISGSLDGKIKFWNTRKSGTLIATYDVGQPIIRMAISDSGPNNSIRIFLATEVISAARVMYRSEIILLTVWRPNKSHIVTLTRSKYPCSGLGVYADGSCAVASYRRNYDVIVFPNGSDVIVDRCTHPKAVTALAVHPKLPIVALGDETGAITIIRQLGDRSVGNPPSTKYHWHAHRVMYLAYSLKGTYLLSGGEEGVLVEWHIDSGQRRFVPRLGAEIKAISVSPDDTIYAVSLANNTVKLVASMNLDLKQAIQGLHVQGKRRLEDVTAGLTIEPRTFNLVINGQPGSLQFYDVHSEKHVFDLDVSQQSLVSRTNNEEITRFQVVYVAFSADERWMATVDTRDDKEHEMESFLKFWRYDDNELTYILHSRLSIRRKETIISLVFDNAKNEGSPKIVTTNVDKRFTIWQLKEQSNTKDADGEVVWVEVFNGLYKDYNPHAAAFSEDDSILAVTFDSKVTLWNTSTYQLFDVLDCLPTSDKLTHVTFINGSGAYLVAASPDRISVWNLITNSVWWSASFPVHHLVADADGSTFAVAGNAERRGIKKCYVCIFNPRSAVPVALREVDGNIHAMVYLPSRATKNTSKDEVADITSNSSSNIIYVNNYCDLHMLPTIDDDSNTIQLKETIRQ